MYNDILANGKIKIEVPQKGVFHVKTTTDGKFRESLLSKYNILHGQDSPEIYDVKENGNITVINDGKYSLTLDKEKNSIVFEGSKRAITVDLGLLEEGFTLDIPMSEHERLFGLGDESRETPMKRGRRAIMWQANVTSYGPIPFMVSSDGWGILVNCTYRHEFDLGAEDKDKIRIEAPKGWIDFYIFLADSMKETINLYTDISGKPLVLPKAAYGLTFVNNEEEGARDVLENCLMFRRDDIPCDVMGLEPGWMSEHYDYSVNKKWDPERFYIPYWLPENTNSNWTFFYNLKQMGFMLSCWLCCDYDLLWHEEGTGAEINTTLREAAGAQIMDDHFRGDAIIMDKITVPTEPWFEHLKKFVDNGVGAFKLDGAMQVMEHPDRIWAGKYLDDEVHNVYPVIYVKQMQQGFSDYTGRRALIYTPSLYAGSQQYTASWAGDTGGGAGIVPFVMNMSFCGHVNASCDLNITEPTGIHFGFLMPWSQVLAWRNWHHPWFLGDELEDIFREYAKMRSSFFPYIYSTAHNAAKTGLGIVRPLPLMYENETKFDHVKNVYMFGDSMLVGVFDMHLTLPEGKWYDWFTGDVYDGDCEIDYNIPEGKGGALFIKEGSVFVTQAPKKYLMKKEKGNYTINIFAGKDCSFDFIEDDGITYDYKEGGYAVTPITVTDSKEDGFTLNIGKRTVANGADIELDELTGFEVKIYASNGLSKVTLCGKEVAFSYDAETKIASFNIAKEERVENVSFNVKF